MNNLFENFRHFLSEEEIEEADRASKKGVKLQRVPEKMNKYLSDDNEPKFFMQFSYINKLGINPRSDWKTPLGIYSYPITTNLLSQFKKGRLPFAQDRKFIIVFSIRPGTKIYNTSPDTLEGKDEAGIPEEEYENLLIKIFSKEMAQKVGNSSFHRSFEEGLNQRRAASSSSDRRFRGPGLLKDPDTYTREDLIAAIEYSAVYDEATSEAKSQTHIVVEDLENLIQPFFNIFQCFLTTST